MIYLIIYLFFLVHLISLPRTNTKIIEESEILAIRIWTNFGLNFISQLEAILNEQDPDDLYNSFLEEYSRQYEICFPLRKATSNKNNRIFTPWITKGLLTAIKKKKRLYKQFLNSSNPQQEARYKLYKNKLNHLIRIAKRNYYDSKFIMAKDNLKETWKLINEVINKRKSRLSTLNLSIVMVDQ